MQCQALLQHNLALLMLKFAWLSLLGGPQLHSCAISGPKYAAVTAADQHAAAGSCWMILKHRNTVTARTVRTLSRTGHRAMLLQALHVTSAMGSAG